MGEENSVPYKKITTTHIADQDQRELFERANDYLADVYSMLSSRPLKRTKSGGCNLTATLVLLCVIDALATHVWPKIPKGNRDDQGKRFKTLIVQQMHWGAAAAGWMKKEEAADLLYIQCRNTLTHELGRDKSKYFQKAGLAEPTVGIWGNVRPKGRIGNIDARTTWPDHWPTVSIMSDQKGTRYKVTVVALYWAVKDMVKKMAAIA